MCRFSCVEGYHPSGSTLRTCQSDGTWSGSSVTCDRGKEWYHTKFKDHSAGAILPPDIA